MRDPLPGKRWKGNEITPDEQFAILLRGNWKCAYCGVAMDDPDFPARDVTIDHLVPRKEGGLTVPENLVPACRTCNSRKCHRPWQDYAPGGARVRIERQVAQPLNLALAKLVRSGKVPTDEQL